MNRKVLSLVALVGLGVALGAVTAGGGCQSDACTKDTDCAMPLICVSSACVPVGTKPDAGADADVEPDVDGDTPPTDTDTDVDGEGDGEGGEEDGEIPEDVVTTDDGGCTPVTSAAYNVVVTAADGDERPVVLRSQTGFVFFGRPPGPVSADGLRFQRFRLDGVASTAAMWTLSSVEIAPQHPILELPDGKFATAFGVPSGAGPGIWVKIIPSTGTGGEVPRQVPGTDLNSGEPAITFDGINVVVVWTHNLGGSVEIRGQLFSASTGAATGTYVTIATGPTGTKEPRIVWGSRRFALAYFNASDGALHVLSLDGPLAEMREDVLTPPVDQSFVGYPAIAWSGTEFGLAWELRVGTSSSTIHLATFMEDAAPVDHTPLEGFVSLSAAEAGQLALAYGDVGSEWALAWRNNQTGRVGISLVRISADDFSIREGPIDIRPGATTAWNPSVAHNGGYYMVSWVEQFGAGAFPIYEATHGCTP
jgi:hypothetical protein